MHRLRHDFKAIAQPLRSDFKSLAKRLRSVCSVISKRLCSNYAVLFKDFALRSRSDFNRSFSRSVRAILTWWLRGAHAVILKRVQSALKRLCGDLKAERAATLQRFQNVPEVIEQHSCSDCAAFVQ
jgi:hypothetical protein